MVLPDNSFLPDEGHFINDGNTQIFLVFPKTNSIINVLGNYDKLTNTATYNDDGGKIPIGWNYEIAVITNKNGQYYYWETSGVTTNGLTVTAAMVPETLFDIKGRLAGL